MAIAGGNIFDPRSLSPALWLSDTGSDPSVWEDLSGNGKNVTQATPANQPAIVASGMNGRQVRRFNGTNGRLSNTTAFLLPSAGSHSIFIVASVIPNGITNTNGIQTILDTNHNVSEGTQIQTRPDLGANRISFFNITNASFVPSVPQLFSAVLTQSTSTLLAVNGVTYTGGAFTHINKQGIYIGHWANGPARHFAQDIAEILVFPTALSTSDRKAVENYLAKKWGIGFNPLSLSPALWLSDTGSNPAQWDDISGNNRHATQATVANQPAIIQNGLAGRQVRRFDGINDFLETAAVSISQPYTAFAVFQSSTTSSLSVVLRGASGGIASGGINLLIHRAAGSAVSGINAGTLYGPFITATSWQIFGTTGSGTNSQVFRDGTSSTVGNAGTNIITRFGIGIDNGSGALFNGDIAEILVFPSALSDTDRCEVERYLAQKWNIIT